MNWNDIVFAYPEAFFLLLLLPVYWIFSYFLNKNKYTAIKLPLIEPNEKIPVSIKARLTLLPLILKSLSLIFLIVALSRPQIFATGENVYTEGIDIVLNLDISGSMLAEDFSPNRLVAAKKITDEFIQGRVNDRIGLVVFSRDAFTQCPLTIDYTVLRTLLSEVKQGMIEDGTAIGNAIANGVNRLKDSESKSKVMILLTDGVNNSGEVDPMTAAEIAAAFGIRVYTIGVGTQGTAPYPFQTPFGIKYQNVPVEIDEKALTDISNLTGGKYFRATNNKKLEEIFKEIDSLEKSKVEVTSYKSKTEKFSIFLIPAVILLLIEFLLSKTVLRRIP